MRFRRVSDRNVFSFPPSLLCFSLDFSASHLSHLSLSLSLSPSLYTLHSTPICQFWFSFTLYPRDNSSFPSRISLFPFPQVSLACLSFSFLLPMYFCPPSLSFSIPSHSQPIIFPDPLQLQLYLTPYAFTIVCVFVCVYTRRYSS